MKKKILFIVEDATLFGGVQRVICMLANLLDSAGFFVKIVSFESNHISPQFPLSDSIDVCYISGPALEKKQAVSEKDTPKKLKISPGYLLRKLLKHMPFAKKIFYFIKRTHEGIRQAQGFDVVFSFSFDQFVPYRRAENTLYVKCIHENFDTARFKYGGLNYFHKLILLCDKEIKRWKKRHKDIRVIPNFISEISTAATNHAQKVIVAVGRLSGEKGFLRLIDIWQEIQKDISLKDWKLHIIGDGPDSSAIEKKILKLSLSNTVILKPFTRKIAEEYLCGSIYVLPSYREALPMVLLESASYGLPAVAFDVNTGPSDIIEDGQSGFLVPDGDIKAFAEKLKVLMKDENLRKTMGLRAKQIVKEKFSKEVILEKWLEILGNPIIQDNS